MSDQENPARRVEPRWTDLNRAGHGTNSVLSVCAEKREPGLGQHRGRGEMQVAWPRLFERIPDLRLAIQEDDIPFKRSSMIYDIKSLRVTTGPQ